MTSLYELAAHHRALEAQLSDLDADTVADTLDGEAGDLDDKLMAYAFVARNQASVAAAKKAAAQSLLDQANKLDRRSVELLDVVHRTMLERNRVKIESNPLLTLSINAKRPSVIITDVKSLPAAFLDVKPAPDPTPSKARLYEALKEGPVAGAVLGSDTTRLEVK